MATDGLTTAIVLFIFACVIVPTLVKNRTQFYAAFFAVLVIILLHSLRLMLHNSPGFMVASGAIIGLLQLLAIVMLFLSAGGISVKQFGGDMARAFEVIRRGEEEKEIIIPRSDMPPRGPATGASAGARRGTDDDEERRVETLDMPAGAGWPTQPPPGGARPPSADVTSEPGKERGTIPLE